tara:strand:- start:239 stop:940 length:702 start_codon:yes stop_codon:yes gene_type:complete
MKQAWAITSFVAVVNLLVLILLAGWMLQTGRLDAERMSALRSWIMSPPEEASEVRQASDPETGPTELSGLSSQQRLEWLEHWRMQSEQRLQGLVEEAERRSLEVQTRLTELELQKQALAVKERTIQEEREARDRQSRDEAFQRTVGLYEQARPDRAKAWLLLLVEEGQTDRAVQYLSAMQTRSASRILQTFDSGTELRLAKQLLEAMSGGSVAADSNGLSSHVHADIQPGITP